MGITLNGFIPLSVPRLSQGSMSIIIPFALASFVIDAADHAIAYKFVAQSTSPITDVDVMLSCIGDTSGCTFTASIQADNAGVPSGTILGATNNALATFAGPAVTSTFWWAGGGTNPLALGENTGNLTHGGLYWLVIKETGTNPDASNYIQAYRTYGNQFVGADVVKLDDGSNAWSHATAITSAGAFVIKNVAGNYYGLCAQSTNASMTGATHIYDNYRQGLKYSVGAQHYLVGVYGFFTKAGSPTDLNVKVYNGSTLLCTDSIPAGTVPNGAFIFIPLATPQLIPADATVYIIFVQKGTDETDGGDNSNDYTISCITYHPTYYTSIKADGNYVGVHGTDTDPTALTVIANNIIPLMAPAVIDTLTGIDSDLPAVGNVTEDDTVNGVTGTYHEATEAEVQSGVTFGADEALTGTYAGGGGGAINLDKMGAM